MLKPKRRTSQSFRLPSKKVRKEVYLFTFPIICGLEDISSKLNSHSSENMFNALLHGFALKPIKNEKSALEAERMIEYLDRVFEEKKPQEVEHYCHVLLLLMQEFDEIHHHHAVKDMLPFEFLKALLKEDNVPQKSLVPDCFKSESQVSEFLHQKNGRQTLQYKQAVALGERFHVNPLNFL